MAHSMSIVMACFVACIGYSSALSEPETAIRSAMHVADSNHTNIIVQTNSTYSCPKLILLNRTPRTDPKLAPTALYPQLYGYFHQMSGTFNGKPWYTSANDANLKLYNCNGGQWMVGYDTNPGRVPSAKQCHSVVYTASITYCPTDKDTSGSLYRWRYWIACAGLWAEAGEYVWMQGY